MDIDKFIKLASGTKEDFMIACNWLVVYTDPIEYIRKHGNKAVNSPCIDKSISWSDDWSGTYIDNNIYYKYADNRYIIRCGYGITVTDTNYDSYAEVIIH